MIYLFYCFVGAPGAETGGGPEAGKGEGLTAELGLGGPGLVAPPRVGKMKSEFKKQFYSLRPLSTCFLHFLVLFLFDADFIF